MRLIATEQSMDMGPLESAPTQLVTGPKGPLGFHDFYTDSPTLGLETREEKKKEGLGWSFIESIVSPSLLI